MQELPSVSDAGDAQRVAANTAARLQCDAAQNYGSHQDLYATMYRNSTAADLIPQMVIEGQAGTKCPELESPGKPNPPLHPTPSYPIEPKPRDPDKQDAPSTLGAPKGESMVNPDEITPDKVKPRPHTGPNSYEALSNPLPDSDTERLQPNAIDPSQWRSHETKIPGEFPGPRTPPADVPPGNRTEID